MKRIVAAFIITVSLVISAASAFAQVGGEVVKPRNYKPPVMTKDEDLATILEFAIMTEKIVVKSGELKDSDVAATVIDVSDAKNFKIASFNGDKQMYTASVVKMFYMAALERGFEHGLFKTSQEIERGERDMIVDSSNDATGYILDVITGTSSGAELPKTAFNVWQYKRNRVNRYFASMGYTNINVNQKTFCEDAYGIEQQSRKYKGANRNMLTTDATARLMAEIVTGNIVGPERTKRMMDLMARDPFNKKDDSQGSEFIGKTLVDLKLTNAKLWSKAGWTSKVRHDAAYIDFGNGRKIVIAIFTENHANNKDIIPGIAEVIINAVRGN